MTTSKTGITALQDYRCSCGKLLFRGSLLAGTVEVKCKRCNAPKMFEFTTTSDTASTAYQQDSQAEMVNIVTN